MHLCRCCCITVSVHVWCGANAFAEFCRSVLPGAPGRCSGGVRVSPGRRSSGYGLLCRPLLPFSRRRGAGVDRVDFVRILTKSTLVLVTEVLRLVLLHLLRCLLHDLLNPGDSVVGHPGDLGELRAGVDRFTFCRILQKVKICPSPLILPRLRRDDMLLRPGGAVVWSVPEVWRHGAGGDPPPMPQCVGLSCRFSGRPGRVQ
jgi:hypothetical protein